MQRGDGDSVSSPREIFWWSRDVIVNIFSAHNSVKFPPFFAFCYLDKTAKWPSWCQKPSQSDFKSYLAASNVFLLILGWCPFKMK